MNLDLKGKTAFVCGSTQGIGKSAAFDLAAMGARIVLIARNTETLKLVKEELDGIKPHSSSFAARTSGG
jgi:3-oxoacyl-[acyl-carrier protein] reductase